MTVMDMLWDQMDDLVNNYNWSVPSTAFIVQINLLCIYLGYKLGLA